MTVEIYQCDDYNTEHERSAVDRIVKSLKEKFEHCDDLVIVLVDYTLKGKDVDLTILKKDAILIVELKEESESFTATLNKWPTASGRNVGGSHSPYSQVRGYRNLWRDELKQNGKTLHCLNRLHSSDFEKATWNTKGIVAISPSLPTGVINEIKKGDAPWFEMCGEDELARIVELATTNFYNFRQSELRSIAKNWLKLEGPYEELDIRKTPGAIPPTEEKFNKLEGVIEELKSKIEQLEKVERGTDESVPSEDIQRIEGLIAELTTKSVTSENLDEIVDWIAETQSKMDELEKGKNGTDGSEAAEGLNQIAGLLIKLISKIENQTTPPADGGGDDAGTGGNGFISRKPRSFKIFGTALVLAATLSTLYFLLNSSVEPQASFSTSTKNLTVNFTDTSTDSDGKIESRSWDFNDGSTSMVQNPSHTYSEGGTYTVTLTVTDDDNLKDSESNNITVADGIGPPPQNEPPQASFSPDITEKTVDFTDLSTDSDGTIVARSWSFGDGLTSTMSNPSHTYLEGGAYTVTLTVTDDGGLRDARSINIQIKEPPPLYNAPQASFSASASDLTVNFTDTSTDSDGRLVAYSWDFGDGGTSTMRDSSHTYVADGTYTVILTVTDSDGLKNSIQDIVTVRGAVCSLGSCCDNPRSWQDARDFVDKTVAFSGPVIDVTSRPDVNGRPTWISVGTTSSGKNLLELLIWGRNLKKFPGIHAIEGKTVCAFGEVQTFREKVQIELKEPSQLKIQIGLE